MIALIAGNELRLMSRSPFAWVAAGILQLVFGWMFLSALEQYLVIQPELAHYPQAGGVTAYLATNWLTPASSVFILASPLICMNLIAAERQSGRYALLACAPISAGQLAIGKFAGATLFQIVVLSINLALAISLTMATRLDWPALLLAWSGMVLLVGAATATSLFFSCLTSRPALAAFASFAFLLMLWLLSASGSPGSGVAVLAQLSPATHLNHFMQGRLQSDALAYFAICTTIFLVLSIRQLNALQSLGARRS